MLVYEIYFVVPCTCAAMHGLQSMLSEVVYDMDENVLMQDVESPIVTVLFPFFISHP